MFRLVGQLVLRDSLGGVRGHSAASVLGGQGGQQGGKPSGTYVFPEDEGQDGC